MKRDTVKEVRFLAVRDNIGGWQGTWQTGLASTTPGISVPCRHTHSSKNDALRCARAGYLEYRAKLPTGFLLAVQLSDYPDKPEGCNEDD